MVHLEGGKNRVTKITQAKFHPKGCQPQHKTSLNKPKKKRGKKNLTVKTHLDLQ